MSVFEIALELVRHAIKVASRSIFQLRQPSVIPGREIETWEAEISPSHGDLRTGPRLRRVKRKRPDTVVEPEFKIVFLAVFAITLISGIAQILMALAWDEPTGNQQAVFEGFGFAWKAGIGAVIGLLGGKVT